MIETPKNVEMSSSKTDPTFQDTTVSVAMQYIENYINYMEADLSLEQHNIIFDTASYIFEISLVGGEYLSGDDQDAIYTSLRGDIYDYETNLNITQYADHALLFVDIDSITHTGEQINFFVTTAVAIKYSDWSDPCNTYDYWLHGGNLGGCMTNSASNSDAALEMNKRLNGQCNQYLWEPNGWFSNIQRINHSTPSINPNDPTPNDGYLDYYLFMDVDRYCVEPFEMDYHINIGAYAQALINAPLNKTLISLDIEPLILTPGTSSIYWHSMDAYFAKNIPDFTIQNAPIY